MLIKVGVSCRFLHSLVGYLYVSCIGWITSVWEEKGNFLLSFTCKYVVSVRSFLFLLVLSAWDKLCYFTVALPVSSI